MTVITQHKKHRDRLVWAALAVFLALLIGYDLRWLSINVTLLGGDPPSHLLKTLTYDRLLQEHSAQSLFPEILSRYCFLKAVPMSAQRAPPCLLQAELHPANAGTVAPESLFRLPPPPSTNRLLPNEKRVRIVRKKGM